MYVNWRKEVIDMTKHYESPVVEIEKYTLCGDICTTSDGQGNGDDNIDLQEF